MRILHCIATLMRGGAERQLSLLASELSALGHDVHVAYLEQGPYIPHLKTSRVHLHQLNSSGNHFDPLLLWKIVRLIHALRPEVVQTWLPLMDLLGGLACRITGTPWVLREASSAVCYPCPWRSIPTG